METEMKKTLVFPMLRGVLSAIEGKETPFAKRGDAYFVQ